MQGFPKWSSGINIKCYINQNLVKKIVEFNDAYFICKFNNFILWRKMESIPESRGIWVCWAGMNMLAFSCNLLNLEIRLLLWCVLWNNVRCYPEAFLLSVHSTHNFRRLFCDVTQGEKHDTRSCGHALRGQEFIRVKKDSHTQHRSILFWNVISTSLMVM
jgi:hypothetical protein